MDNYFVIVRKDDTIVWSGEFLAVDKPDAINIGSEYYKKNIETAETYVIETTAYRITKDGKDDTTMAFRIALNSRYGK